MKTHPHADASYRVVSLAEGGFGVEMTMVGSYPATIKSFASEQDADAWIARKREQVQTEVSDRHWFKRSKFNRRTGTADQSESAAVSSLSATTRS
jgi:hypothetical protein